MRTVMIIKKTRFAGDSNPINDEKKKIILGKIATIINESDNRNQNTESDIYN